MKAGKLISISKALAIASAFFCLPAGAKSEVLAGIDDLNALRPDKAISAFTPALIADSRVPVKDAKRAHKLANVLAYIGRSFTFDENTQAASQAFALAHKLWPENIGITASLCETENRLCNWKAVGELTKQLEPEAKKDLSAAAALASVKMSQTDYAAAEKILQAGLTGDKKTNPARALGMLGRSYLRLGNEALGESHYIEASKKATSEYMRKMYELSAALARKDIKGAVACARQAGASIPDDPCWHNSLGTSLCLMQKDKEGLEEFEKAVNSPRMMSRGFEQLAEYLNLHDRKPEAIKCLRHLEKMQPWNSEVHVQLARCLKGSCGTNKDAEPEFKQAIAMNPRSAHRRVELAQFYVNRQENEEALKLLKDTVANCPYSASAWVMLAQLNVILGHWDDAQAAAEKHTRFARGQLTVGQQPGPVFCRIDRVIRLITAIGKAREFTHDHCSVLRVPVVARNHNTGSGNPFD